MVFHFTKLTPWYVATTAVLHACVPFSIAERWYRDGVRDEGVKEEGKIMLLWLV